jgi:serine/threonine protein phosphatase PrpC
LVDVEYRLTKEDRIILLASDGVFEFLENKQIIEEMSPFYENKQVQQGSDHLLSLAQRAWS